ncbi:hypothetical protein ACFFSW_34480 [Saccharothrix longispora]|uniref:Excreted virulence factor EspC (Type VII ESX diderm) n=1 Tax=Saccharothrix longispora TaxID=33920 RepID=A0ABU1PLV1_9PSEU|nr:hypothetical protein [Saccharothrix longispora]MDR6591634.1 hypothetical protein [Saccharothrix longispora]
MTDISVALEAMRADAALWTAAADNLDGPRSAIGGLVIADTEMSQWAADRGMHHTYEDARVALEDVLAKAVEAFRGLGESLHAAANTYESEEEANRLAMDRLHGEGGPR